MQELHNQPGSNGDGDEPSNFIKSLFKWLGRISIDTWVQIAAGIVISMFTIFQDWVSGLPIIRQHLDKTVWMAFIGSALLIGASLRNGSRKVHVAYITLGVVMGLVGFGLQIQKPWCEAGEIRVRVIANDDGTPIKVEASNIGHVAPNRRLQLHVYVATTPLDPPQPPRSTTCRGLTFGDGYIEGEECTYTYQMGQDSLYDEVQIQLTRPSCGDQGMLSLFLHPLL